MNFELLLANLTDNFFIIQFAYSYDSPLEI